jgi:hypothetical protein
MRVRLAAARTCTAVAVIGVSLSLVAASPAGAATTVSKAEVVEALLTADDLGSPWQKLKGSGSGSDSAGPDAVSCLTTSGYRAVGIKRQVSRSFKYGTQPLALNETVIAFGTVAQAKADFDKTVKVFAGCSSFRMDDKDWTMVRVASPSYADQRAKYRVSGVVASASGDVPVTSFLTMSRYGRHGVIVALAIGGAGYSTAMIRNVSKNGTRGSKLATAKVAAFLGR